MGGGEGMSYGGERSGFLDGNCELYGWREEGRMWRFGEVIEFNF